MNIVACIFARGGSKGLPGKNIKLFAGKPLIAWAIEQAFSLAIVSRVIVSTDCPDIAAVAKEFGAEVPFLRPNYLALDKSPEWLSWQHLIRYLEGETGIPDAILSLPTTSPLRTKEDIEGCLELFAAERPDVVITVTDAHRNPYFNMVQREGGLCIKPVLTFEAGISRRQDAPEVYDMTTVAYVFNPKFVLSHSSLFEGRVMASHIPVHRAIDIDTALDFEWAQFLLEKIKSGEI